MTNDILEFNIDIFSEEVIAKLKHQETIITFKNIITVRREDHIIFAIGKNIEEFKEELYLEDLVEIKVDDYEFISIADAIQLFPSVAAIVLLDLLSHLYAKPIYVSGVSSIINIDFIGYEKLDPDAKNEFEFILAKYSKAKKLFVNGVDKHISYRKAIFLQMTYLGSICLTAFLLLGVGSLIGRMLGRFFGIDEIITMADVFLSIGIIFIPIFLFMGLGVWSGELVWMLVMRIFYPKSTLRSSILYFFGTNPLTLNPISRMSHRFFLT